MILAAGRGERMRPLTDTLPKPLLSVGSRCLIEYHLQSLEKSGFHEVVINLAWLGEKIKKKLGDGNRFNIPIQYSYEGTEGLETGGGIYNALPLLGEEPFCVINGDVWTDYPLEPVDLLGKLAHLVLVDNPSHHPKGDYCLNKKNISLTQGKCLTFSGIGFYHPKFFAHCQNGRFPLAPMIEKAIKNNQVSGEHYQGQWFDVGTPERLDELNEFIK